MYRLYPNRTIPLVKTWILAYDPKACLRTNVEKEGDTECPLVQISMVSKQVRLSANSDRQTMFLRSDPKKKNKVEFLSPLLGFMKLEHT